MIQRLAVLPLGSTSAQHLLHTLGTQLNHSCPARAVKGVASIFLGLGFGDFFISFVTIRKPKQLQTDYPGFTEIRLLTVLWLAQSNPRQSVSSVTRIFVG